MIVVLGAPTASLQSMFSFSMQSPKPSFQTNFIQERQLMNSTQNISGLKNPRELRGVLVCDASMLRDGIVGSNPKRTASILASGYLMSQVNN
jgi:hypothetical protein